MWNNWQIYFWSRIKKTTSGISVTSFCLAVDRKYQPSGEEKKTDFIDFIAWRNTAELICKYFSKGSMIGIEGEIQTRTYTDKNGNNKKATEIVVSNVTFCGSKTDNSQYTEQSTDFSSTSDFEEMDDSDDLPF